MEVFIGDLSKAEVLMVLFNASAPLGLGVLQASRGPHVMTLADAQFALGNPDAYLFTYDAYHLSYVWGRPIKARIGGDRFNAKGFDDHNGGEGTAQRVIDAYRSSKSS